MLDARSESVDITIGKSDFIIKQSPGILRSNRETGTTGAAVWRTSVRFAEWLARSDNVLFESEIMNNESNVMELGSGISALVPLVLRERVMRIIATDQHYALKLLRENLDANTPALKAKGTMQTRKQAEVLALDWETDDIAAFMRLHGLSYGIDAVLICDCVFNYALIQPLVNTCAEICAVRQERPSEDYAPRRPTVCIVAQQLRQPDVFEQWLRAFLASFRVWRVPEDLMTNDLREGSGFAIHIGILR